MIHRNLLKALLLAMLPCCSPGNAVAAVRLPALISDNMVLQQNSTVTLWGWADPGENVQVQPSWSSKPLAVKAGKDSTWQVQLKTGKGSYTAYSIRFHASNDITVQHVLLGEVWLASGQSNMEFPLGKAESWRTGVEGYEAVLAAANDPYMRMIDVENTVADKPLADIKGSWQACTPQAAADFSAVAYFFAANLRKSLDVPLGIVNSTWGGTPAESWTRREVLEQNPDLQPILERYKTACDAYPGKYAVYKEKYEHWKADTSSHKKGAPKEPLGPNSNKSPYKLYNGMIAPLLHYRFKGVIWYQGESNADYAYNYRNLFPAMIRSWRTDFGAPDLPFYFVQIAPHKGQNPVIRESQYRTLYSVAHTGMVVTTDVGNADDIHPRNKKPVGDRLSWWALHELYGRKDIAYQSPQYGMMKSETGHVMILQFFPRVALTTTGGAAPTGFTIAGADRQFVPAQAKINGDRIEVWSDSVAQPVAVRFGWQNVPEVNVFSKDGLPLGPFRTDDWPVETQDKK